MDRLSVPDAEGRRPVAAASRRHEVLQDVSAPGGLSDRDVVRETVSGTVGRFLPSLGGDLLVKTTLFIIIKGDKIRAAERMRLLSELGMSTRRGTIARLSHGSSSRQKRNNRSTLRRR